MQNGKTERKETPNTYAQSHSPVQPNICHFHRIAGEKTTNQTKPTKNPPLQFAEVTQGTGKSECGFCV